MTVLTNAQIKSALDSGDIVCTPFNPERLNNGSIDVSLGRYVWRQNQGVKFKWLHSLDNRSGWYLCDLLNEELELDSMERVLVHTHEFIGSRRGSIPMMKAKSTTGRHGLTVAICAGWGDQGYVNRWCLEMQNLNPFAVSLNVGTAIGQVVFMAMADVPPDSSYEVKGSYQAGSDIETIMREWTPESLLPKPMKRGQWSPVCPADELP